MVAKAAIVGATILAIVIVAAIVSMYIAKRNERIRARDKGQALRGDLNRGEEIVLVNLLQDAAEIFRGLGKNTSLDDVEIIRADTRIDVGRWLAAYDVTKEKIER
jgi:hypothetical protein